MQAQGIGRDYKRSILEGNRQVRGRAREFRKTGGKRLSRLLDAESLLFRSAPLLDMRCCYCLWREQREGGVNIELHSDYYPETVYYT